METVNHSARALSLLVSQYKGKANLRAIVSAIAAECDQLETALQDLFSNRALSTAEGAQLDGWGRILNTPRLGLSDSEYRARLEIRIAEIYSEGTGEDLLGIFYRLSGAEKVLMREYYPASLELQALNPASLISDAGVKAALVGAKVAGVELHASYSVSPAFAFAEYIPAGDEIVAGFDDGSETVGGILSKNI